MFLQDSSWNRLKEALAAPQGPTWHTAEPMDIPSVGRMTLIHDPLGAHIWLYKPAEM